MPVILGLGASPHVWALLAGAGFAALVTASEMAHLVLRVVGAAVLLGLGIRAWWAMWRESRQPDTVGEPVPSPGPRRGWTAFGEGLLVQLANSKAAVLVLAVYPQFVPVDEAVFATTPCSSPSGCGWRSPVAESAQRVVVSWTALPSGSCTWATR